MRKILRKVYDGAKERCNNPNHISYYLYGGRGIQFKISFEEFLKELGPRPIGYTLDRINNNGHYEIGNIKWSSKKEQANNKRKTPKSRTNIYGVSIRNPSYAHRTLRYAVRVIENNKRKLIYIGPDFFEACCRRKSWEQNN